MKLILMHFTQLNISKRKISTCNQYKINIKILYFLFLYKAFQFNVYFAFKEHLKSH